MDFIDHCLEKKDKLDEDEKKRYYIFNPAGEYLSDYEDLEGDTMKDQDEIESFTNKNNEDESDYEDWEGKGMDPDETDRYYVWEE